MNYQNNSTRFIYLHQEVAKFLAQFKKKI